MNTIYYLPSTEKKYFIQCHLCRDFIDKRNLNEVVHHDTGDCLAGASQDAATFSKSIMQEGKVLTPKAEDKAKLNIKIKDFLSQLIGH